MKRFLHLHALTLLSFGSCFTAPAFAQTLPSSADPARINERITIREQDRSVAPIAPTTDINNTPIPIAENGFILKNIILSTDSHSLPDDVLENLYTEYTGMEVDLNVLNHLAARLTALYQERGYFLSRAFIPQQEVINGTVKISIIEGYASEVNIEDPKNLLSKDHLNVISGALGNIANIRPLNAETLERQILLLNDNFGVSAQFFIKEASNNKEMGGVNLVLRILPETPINTLGYNNHGSRYVGSSLARYSHRRGQIFTSTDSILFDLNTAIPASELKYAALDYTLPLTSDGWVMRLLAAASHSKPGLNLQDLEVTGDSFSTQMNISYPIKRSRRESLYVGGGIKMQNTQTEFLDQELIDDKTRSLGIFAQYNVQDQYLGQNSLYAQMRKGFEVLGASHEKSDKLSRSNGRVGFFKIDAELQRDQPFPAHNINWMTKLRGQYAPHPLLSAQEIGFGGINYGRAYDSSEITGDQGIMGATELRYTGINKIENLNLQLVPFAYYDLGKVWNEDSGSKPISAASSGFGTYYNFSENIYGSLQIAWPLTKQVDTPVMNGENGPRILFDIKISF